MENSLSLRIVYNMSPLNLLRSLGEGMTYGKGSTRGAGVGTKIVQETPAESG